MAREEADREDLLREATAYVERVELEIPGYWPSVFAGFRRTGEASFYFGPDYVLHFNSACELRRAFSGGKLLASERGTLIELTRARTESQVQLQRRKLTAAETSAFVAKAITTLRELRAQLAAGNYQIIGQVPADGAIVRRIESWLETLMEIRLARSPRTR